jgi:hypothetical protein
MSDNHVYILGAGSSADLDFAFSKIDLDPQMKPIFRNFSTTGPLSSGFFYYTNQLKKIIESKAVQRIISFNIELSFPHEVIKYLINKKQIFTEDDLLDDERESKRINIEKLYVELKERMEGGDKEARYLMNSLTEFIGSVMSYFSFYCVSKNHGAFC